MTNHAQPLAGRRVLDLTQFLSGPFCTQILGDLGAEIIKVEAPEGDLARGLPPHFIERDSLYYLSINRNKKSIVIDLKTKEGLGLLFEMAEKCDVLVENFRPGVLERLGISADAILEKCPKLVWCSISGFGQSGPYREFPAYDMIVQAISGSMSLNGEPGRDCVRTGIPIGDLCAGLYGCIAILSSLADPKRQNRKIDISMLDCQIAMLSYQAAFYLQSGTVPGRQGRSHDSIPTYNTFETADHDVVITANTEKMWKSLCTVLGLPKLPDDPRFRTNVERHNNRDQLLPLLQKAFLRRSSDEWVVALRNVQVPVAVVNTLDRAFADPQVVHRDMVSEMQTQDGRRVSVAGNPIHFQGQDKIPDRYPPRLGEDTRDVLRDMLNLSNETIDEMLSASIVRDARLPQ